MYSFSFLSAFSSIGLPWPGSSFVNFSCVIFLIDFSVCCGFAVNIFEYPVMFAFLFVLIVSPVIIALLGMYMHIEPGVCPGVWIIFILFVSFVFSFMVMSGWIFGVFMNGLIMVVMSFFSPFGFHVFSFVRYGLSYLCIAILQPVAFRIASADPVWSGWWCVSMISFRFSGFILIFFRYCRILFLFFCVPLSIRYAFSSSVIRYMFDIFVEGILCMFSVIFIFVSLLLSLGFYFLVCIFYVGGLLVV